MIDGRNSQQEAAAQLNVSLRTVERLVAERKIRTVRIGRRVWIPQTAIDQFIRRHTHDAVGG